MGSVVVLAVVVWLFLLVLAVAILRRPRWPTGKRSGGNANRPSAPGARDCRRQAAVPRWSSWRCRIAGGCDAAAPDADAAGCNTAARGRADGGAERHAVSINRQRRAHRLAPLVGNARLGLRREPPRLGHDPPRLLRARLARGDGVLARLRIAGYMRGCTSWAAGETLAWGNGTESSPWSRVAAWMRSPPHRAVLLGATYREAGIAVMQGTPGMGPRGFTYVGEFGRRRC